MSDRHLRYISGKWWKLWRSPRAFINTLTLLQAHLSLASGIKSENVCAKREKLAGLRSPTAPRTVRVCFSHPQWCGSAGVEIHEKIEELRDSLCDTSEDFFLDFCNFFTCLKIGVDYSGLSWVIISINSSSERHFLCVHFYQCTLTLTSVQLLPYLFLELEKNKELIELRWKLIRNKH